MRCSCGRWEFRDLVVTTSLAALERYCPKCERKMLLVFRGPGHVATVELKGGRHAARIEASLRQSGLEAAEVALLMIAFGDSA